MTNMIPYRRNKAMTRNDFFSDPFFKPFFGMDEFFTGNSFRVDVKDLNDHFELEAELPGVEQDKIQLYTENDMLTISADTGKEERVEKEHYLYCERRTGHFHRSFDLEGIDAESITAAYKDGVLRVNLPKAKPAAENSRKQIQIQ